jgi:hypothetical protein
MLCSRKSPNGNENTNEHSNSFFAQAMRAQSKQSMKKQKRHGIIPFPDFAFYELSASSLFARRGCSPRIVGVILDRTKSGGGMVTVGDTQTNCRGPEKKPQSKLLVNLI